jgi:hypothetical protein
MPADSERDDRLEGRTVDRSRATLNPFTGNRCFVWIRGQLTLCLRHSLVRAYGIYVLTLNSNLYSNGSGVSGLTWRSWFLGKLITCITGGVRVREEQWELVTPLVLSEAAEMRHIIRVRPLVS